MVLIVLNKLAPNRRIFQAVGVSLAAALMYGCAKEEKDTYTYLWDNKFNSCGLNCHNPNANVGEGAANGPDLSSKDKFYTNLLNRSVNGSYPLWIGAGGRTVDCNDVKFIKPYEANKSTLAASLILSASDTLKASDKCDSAWNFHDLKNVTIKDAELAQALTDWINKGAVNN